MSAKLEAGSKKRRMLKLFLLYPPLRSKEQGAKKKDGKKGSLEYLTLSPPGGVILSLSKNDIRVLIMVRQAHHDSGNTQEYPRVPMIEGLIFE
jgi:hypothetical protein